MLRSDPAIDQKPAFCLQFTFWVKRKKQKDAVTKKQKYKRNGVNEKSRIKKKKEGQRKIDRKRTRKR